MDKFQNFSKKKCIIHLVELDELFSKMRFRDQKTACGRYGAHAKFENTAQCFWWGAYALLAVRHQQIFKKQLVT